MKPTLKKGAILLQTLVASVLLSMLAVMVMRWVLARYIVANRVMGSTKNVSFAKGGAEYGAQTIKSATDWDLAPSGEILFDDNNIGKVVRYSSSGSRITVTVPE